MKENQIKKQAIIDFYRDEFKKHYKQLIKHKSSYSNKTYIEINQALSRLIANIEQIYQLENFEQLASELLKKIDIVTQLSSTSDANDKIH